MWLHGRSVSKYGIIYLMDFSQDELKLLFAVLTQEKFTLGDSVVLAPLAIKIKGYIKEDKPVESISPTPATPTNGKVKTKITPPVKN